MPAAGAAVIREVGNYDHYYGALQQLQEQRLANGTTLCSCIMLVANYAFGFMS